MPRHEWESADAAAQRLGRNRGHVRKLCPRIAALGKARKLRTGRTKPGWQVRKDFELIQLYSAKGIALQTKATERAAGDGLFASVPLDGLPSRTAATVALRMLILHWWEESRREAAANGDPLDKAADGLLSRLRQRQGIDLTRSTLYNWQRRFAEAGAIGLADRRQIKHCDAAGPEEATITITIQAPGGVVIDGARRRGSKPG